MTTAEAMLENARASISRALAELQGLFEPKCRLTFVMRDPDDDDCSMIVTNDPSLVDVARVVGRLERGDG